jgi:hypothetical protein
MAHSDGVRTLKHIVQKALWLAKREPNEYFRFHELACDGLRELRLHHVHEGLKFAKLTQSSIGTVDFPEDFLDFRGIAVPVAGKLVWLTRNNDIVMTTTMVGAQETQDSDDEEGVDILDSATAGFYARGGVNLDGYYNIDYQNRRIFLNSVTRTEVVLAYLTSGAEISEETYVPTKYEQILIAWIVWRDTMYDEQRIKLAEYYESRYLKELVGLDEGYTIEELLDALASTYTMLPLR